MDAPKLLVVDDQPINVQLLKRKLEREGIHVLEAYSGLEAIDVTLREKPDLILLDVMMPDMNGIEVCQRLQANEDTRTIPVIFITARTSKEGKLEGLGAGAVDYITKPIDLDETLARVQTHLRFVSINRELADLQSRLAESRRIATIGAVTQGIAHNLNNLLGIVIGYLDLVKAFYDKPEQVQKNAKHVEDAVHRIVGIIRQLSTLMVRSRPPVVRMPLQRVLELGVARYQADYGIPYSVKIDNPLGDLQIETNVEIIEEVISKVLINAWETADPRFDATPYPDQAHGGHVNEPNRFGWVVEIDPFDPQAQPIKRTAFGRFSRECAALSLGDDGRMAFYSGDDAKGEYLYKFVPSGRHDAANPKASRDLLDHGTLYVAKLHADGSGQWLALVHGQNDLSAEHGFPSQAEVLVNARAAADRAGATPMDRPEWAAVHPKSREVYVTLTNNDGRGSKQPVDKANPRPNNLHGQILRFNEQGADPTATTFTWELFLLAGEARGAKGKDGQPVPANLTGTINGDVFSSPDGVAFDAAGRLWIQTDYDDAEPAMQAMGCNQLLCADPSSREVRRFLVGPRGCEITGLAWSPDGKAMWANIQHPGISFPASDGKTRPRSTTVLITKLDGGVIGS